MAPAKQQQLRWGIVIALIAAVVIAVLAFVPDPLFRQRVMTTTFDDVTAILPGTPVFFRGAEIGAVRSVELDPPSRLFAVRLGVRRDWRPSACSFAEVVATNPLTTPRVELVAVEQPATRCPAARAAALCDRLASIAPPGGAPGGAAIDGCRRAPDLLQSAAAAISETTAVARTANQMATRLAAMLSGPGSSTFDMAGIAHDSTAALAALSGVAQRLDSSMAPRGDLALTLANVRRVTGSASRIDVANINGTLSEVRALVAQNQKSIAGILAEGSQTTGQARAMLEDLSASLNQTSANLARASDSAAALGERLAASPTYALHGRKFADPPAPGAAP